MLPISEQDAETEEHVLVELGSEIVAQAINMEQQYWSGHYKHGAETDGIHSTCEHLKLRTTNTQPTDARVCVHTERGGEPVRQW